MTDIGEGFVLRSREIERKHPRSRTMLYLPCCQFHNQLPRRPRQNQGHAAPLRTEKRILAHARDRDGERWTADWRAAGNPDAGCRGKFPMNSTDIQASPYGLAWRQTLGSSYQS